MAAITLALPQTAEQSGQGVLPLQTLSGQDAELYQTVFTAQAQGEFAAADKAIRQIDNPILMGHVLAQRYLHPRSGRTSFAKLRRWMSLYGDHSEASRIYKLALKRRPKGASLARPRKPLVLPDTVSAEGKPAHILSARAWRLRQNQCRRNEVISALRKRQTDQAARILHEASYPQRTGTASFQSCQFLVVRDLFLRHRDADALYAASVREPQEADEAVETWWWAGLAAFRQGQYVTAARYFVRASSLDVPRRATLVSASAYWAARSYMRVGAPYFVNDMLWLSYRTAPFSFYGHLASENLGYPLPYNWENPSWQDLQEHQHVFHFPAARRMIALLQTGKKQQAEKEFRLFAHLLPYSWRHAWLLVAQHFEVPDLVYAMAWSVERGSGQLFHQSLYPLPRWYPADGFKLEPALIFAFVRQESGFNPQAISSAGALGLMQLMPATARFVNRGKITRTRLHDPQTNLKLGQNYILYLMNKDTIGRNMLFFVASYNAGPGNVVRWRERAVFHDDPLLYIETIPVMETRIFVKRVMANFWTYREKYGTEASTRRAVARGEWPHYDGAVLRRGVLPSGTPRGGTR